MAPLAGRPPFATDQPDSYYDSARPAQRVPRQNPDDPNKRTSAYNMYDNYLGADLNKPSDPAVNRHSGVDALGMGLLNMADDDDSDSDDDGTFTKPQQPPASKHTALAAATGARVNASSPAPQQRGPSPTNQQQQRTSPAPSMPVPAPSIPIPTPARSPPPRSMPSPQPIAAPQPGYAAPVAALNLPKPEAAAAPAGRRPPPPNININNSNNNPFNDVQNPFQTPSASPRSPFIVPSASPSPSLLSSSPHPLQPPMTPITPVFARPAKPSSPGVSFSVGDPIPRNKPILRGNSEETLLPQRGEKGDDFWRRFSMVAKEEKKAPKESIWLRKARNGSNTLSRWVWIVSVLLIICIGGAIGLGIYFGHKSPSHQQPVAIGGSANEVSTFISTTSSKHVSSTSSAKATIVTPTNTVARRMPQTSSVPAAHRRQVNRLQEI